MMWFQRSDAPAVRAKENVHPPKVLLTVFWSPKGFAAIEARSQWQRFHLIGFSEAILTLLHVKSLIATHETSALIHLGKGGPVDQKWYRTY
jgi:hypothetical protein